MSNNILVHFHVQIKENEFHENKRATIVSFQGFINYFNIYEN